MLEPLRVAAICPARNALLLLESSQDSPVSSNDSFHADTSFFIASTYIGLLKATVLPSRSTSIAPWLHMYGYAQLGGSPWLWPNACPIGWPAALSFLPTAKNWSHVRSRIFPVRACSTGSGTVAPASLSQLMR